MGQENDIVTTKRELKMHYNFLREQYDKVRDERDHLCAIAAEAYVLMEASMMKLVPLVIRDETWPQIMSRLLEEQRDLLQRLADEENVDD